MLGIENIERKEDIKHRINKTDFVISLDFENEYEEYSKINNLIILTKSNNKKEIMKMVNELNTKDIIYLDENKKEYIEKRIKKVIYN